jgi:hypothetical protein
MGQAKNRGTREDRIAFALLWTEAHHEKWDRERPERELLEQLSRRQRGKSMTLPLLLAALPAFYKH